MKALFWVLSGILVTVGAVVLALRSDEGYVQIVWPPHRVEVSLLLAAAALLIAFALFYLGLRLVFAMVAMPRNVREYRQARRKRKGLEALTEALQHYFSGRFARAEQSATTAMDMSEQPGLAAMLAARAAHELRSPERRDAHLARGAAHLPADDTLRVVTEADLMLKERRAGDALNALQAMPQKHTGGLRLELKALQLSNQWEKSLVVIDQLEKRKVYDAAHARELRVHALAEHLKRHATDVSSLDDAWRKVPDTLRRDARVVRAMAQGYIALDAGDRAAALIERSVEQTWDSELAGLYADCAGANTVAHIERAERWLAAHPGDAALLLTLARLCAKQSLWGKAQNYIDASIAVEASYPAHLAAAQLHEKLGNADVAQRHTRLALELALVKLRERETE